MAREVWPKRDNPGRQLGEISPAGISSMGIKSIQRLAGYSDILGDGYVGSVGSQQERTGLTRR